jgi:hypothetical protein
VKDLLKNFGIRDMGVVVVDISLDHLHRACIVVDGWFGGTCCPCCIQLLNQGSVIGIFWWTWTSLCCCHDGSESLLSKKELIEKKIGIDVVFACKHFP